MKICKCPGCCEFVHFEPTVPLQRCWQCGLLTDFSAVRFQTPEERLMLKGESLFNSLSMCLFSSCSRLIGTARVALVAALPVAVMMLLLCNSFDIRLVSNPIFSFLTP